MKALHLVCILAIIFIIGCNAPIEKYPLDEQPIINAEDEQPVIDEEQPEISQDIPVEEIIEEQPANNIIIEIPEEKPITPPENIVYIKKEGFDPKDFTIYKGEEVIWKPDLEVISNNQPRKIACYSQGVRIFMSEKLIGNHQKAVFRFDKPGEYLCQEFIYGLRGNIKVKKMSRPIITGAVVGALTETQFLPLAAVLGIILLGVIYTKKHSS